MEWWSAGVMGKRNPPILLYFNTPLRLLASEIFLSSLHESLSAICQVRLGRNLRGTPG